MRAACQNVAFASSNLTLEGVLHLPQGPGKFPGVVICHPHPRYGGNMENGVVVGLARSLHEAGLAALRFNFRGVGASQGTFDRGVGEAQDALEAVRYLTLHDRIDASRVGVAGYSFGAWMALEACGQSSLVQAAASIACPLRPFTELGARELLQPKLLVLGELDHDFPVAQFKFLAGRFAESKQVEVIRGADHFFQGQEAEVGEIVARFFGGRLGIEAQPGPGGTFRAG